MVPTDDAHRDAALGESVASLTTDEPERFTQICLTDPGCVWKLCRKNQKDSGSNTDRLASDSSWGTPSNNEMFLGPLEALEGRAKL